MTEKSFIDRVAAGEIPQFTIDLESHMLKYDWMGIHAAPGTSVIYTGFNGYDSDREYAEKFLKVGHRYTVSHIEIGGWSSDVELEEVPGKKFNTVHFALREKSDDRA